MSYSKRFVFSDSTTSSEEDCLEVSIPEILDPNYGMYTWPAAPVLGQYIYYNRHHFRGKKVLEISAGTALAGVVAALCGAQIILSDSSYLPESIENGKRSCLANNINNYQLIGITWGQISPLLNCLPPVDFILGSDCFYDPRDFEDIIVTVAYILSKNVNAKFVCSYQVRSADWNIVDLLRKWNCKCKYIPLSDFSANTANIAQSGLPGRSIIELYEITRA